jgi:hypothetical protein
MSVRIEIEGDSRDYEILKKAASDIKEVPGLTCEIGVRMGMGSAIIMQETQSGRHRRHHIGIDPYGNIEYSHGDYCECPSCQSGWKNSPANYTNSLKQKFLKAIYDWCYMTGAEFTLYAMEDTEFFKRFDDGVPIYSNPIDTNDENYKDKIGAKQIINDYALVHIDGPHDLKSVQVEVDFFINRISNGGYIVFDDVSDYDHHVVDKRLKNYGYVLIGDGLRKKSYKKVKS